MDNATKLVGERIRDIRNGRNWSQEELADRANISRSYMGEIERGQSSATIESLEKITDALEISLEDLFKNLKPQSNSQLTLLINKINILNTKNLEEILDFIEVLYRWKTKRD